MLAHYFGEELSGAQARAVGELLSGEDGSLVMTPAMMEQMCSEFATVDALLAHLQAL